jgi:hypothetical protein
MIAASQSSCTSLLGLGARSAAGRVGKSLQALFGDRLATALAVAVAAVVDPHEGGVDVAEDVALRGEYLGVGVDRVHREVSHVHGGCRVVARRDHVLADCLGHVLRLIVHAGPHVPQLLAEAFSFFGIHGKDQG